MARTSEMTQKQWVYCSGLVEITVSKDIKRIQKAKKKCVFYSKVGVISLKQQRIGTMESYKAVVRDVNTLKSRMAQFGSQIQVVPFCGLSDPLEAS